MASLFEVLCYIQNSTYDECMGDVDCSQVIIEALCIENIKGGQNRMNIIVTSIFVEDQDKALEFYSETLGFVKKQDVPAGQFRWITLVPPDEQDGTELLLEPNAIQPPKNIKRRYLPMASQQQCNFMSK